jgi:hypothetical protein
MSVPKTNISGAKIRSQLYDSAGEFSLNSTEARDAVRKKSGDVAYSDFAGFCWGAGRGYAQSASGDLVLPYIMDSRRDGSNIGAKENRFKVNIVRGLPEYEATVSPYNSASGAGATTANSYFVSESTGKHTLRFTGEQTYFRDGGSRCYSKYYAVEFSDGYMSGNREVLFPEKTISSNTTAEYSFDFNPTAVGTYVQPVWVARHSGYELGFEMSELNLKIRNARITV